VVGVYKTLQSLALFDRKMCQQVPKGTRRPFDGATNRTKSVFELGHSLLLSLPTRRGVR
jgi:hypothetical protein